MGKRPVTGLLGLAWAGIALVMATGCWRCTKCTRPPKDPAISREGARVPDPPPNMIGKKPTGGADFEKVKGPDIQTVKGSDTGGNPVKPAVHTEGPGPGSTSKKPDTPGEVLPKIGENTSNKTSSGESPLSRPPVSHRRTFSSPDPAPRPLPTGMDGKTLPPIGSEGVTGMGRGLVPPAPPAPPAGGPALPTTTTGGSAGGVPSVPPLGGDPLPPLPGSGPGGK